MCADYILKGLVIHTRCLYISHEGHNTRHANPRGMVSRDGHLTSEISEHIVEIYVIDELTQSNDSHSRSRLVYGTDIVDTCVCMYRTCTVLRCTAVCVRTYKHWCGVWIGWCVVSSLENRLY